jgi:thioredoxin:protein disulfide reductase
VSSLFDVANDWVGRQLAMSTGAAAFVYLAMGGLLASLLPCVYPLYPITAAILRDRQSRLGRLAHPLAYYAGLCATYLAFGVIAALAGGAFNSVLRMPGANLAIGAVLLVLALATIGLLHFPLFNAGDDEGHGLSSTVLMGAAAGLLSSACVGPIVVSILLQLAAHSDQLTLASIIVTAAKMLAFGAGVGAPLLFTGLAGVSLPRGGRWMIYVQWAFGLLIGYSALGYFDKALLGFGFSERIAQAMLVSGAMVLVAAYARQPAEASVDQRTKAALMSLVGVVGILVLGRALLAQEQPETVARAAEPSGPAVERKGSLKWHLDKAAAYEEAAKTGRPVFVDFHGDWCTNCKAFQEQTLRDQQLRTALERAVLLKVYDSTPQFTVYRDDPRFPELRIGLPFFAITDAKGELLYKTNDFTKTDEMALFLSDT